MILAPADTSSRTKVGFKLSAESAAPYCHAGARINAVKVSVGDWYAI